MNVSIAMPVMKQIGMIFLRIGASGMLAACGFIVVGRLARVLLLLCAQDAFYR